MSGLALHRLVPAPPVAVDVAAAYRDAFGPAPDDRPYVTVNMVASLDGRAALNGRSGGLSVPSDKAVFHHLRGLADAVLVGAQTVRVEGYGTVEALEDTRVERQQRCQPAAAALAIVSRTLQVDLSSPVFRAPTQPPFLIVPADAPPHRLSRAEAVATVVRAGSGDVDLALALAVLRSEHGVRRLLCEGGPTLNAHLAQAGLIDQLCLTVRATLAGGDGPPLLAPAAGADQPLECVLVSALRSGSDLLLRYRLTGSRRRAARSGCSAV